jgi:hypothetical protein
MGQPEWPLSSPYAPAANQVWLVALAPPLAGLTDWVILEASESPALPAFEGDLRFARRLLWAFQRALAKRCSHVLWLYWSF